MIKILGDSKIGDLKRVSYSRYILVLLEFQESVRHSERTADRFRGNISEDEALLLLLFEFDQLDMQSTGQKSHCQLKPGRDEVLEKTKYPANAKKGTKKRRK